MNPSRTYMTPTFTAALAVACLAAFVGCEDHPTASPDAAAAHAASATPPPVTSAPASHDAAPSGSMAKKVRGPCSHDRTVTFDDPVIERVVRRQLQQPAGPITRASLHGIKTFDVKQATMDDLDPCLFSELTGVKELGLPGGSISDLSPLRGMVRLEGLGLARTSVKDLGPIAGFAHLDRLDLSHTPVTDLKVVGGFTLLTELQIDDTTVSDLAPLAKLTKLEVLSIQNTPVQSLAPLHGLTHLKKLYIAGSLVQDISPVQGLQGLKIFQQGR